MTVNLESFRYPFETEIANESEGAKTAHRNTFQGILDLNQAVASLKSQMGSSSTTTSTGTTASSTTSSSSETVVSNTATTTIGYVNDQTAVTAYTTQQSDYAKYIILDDAAAIAVTLNTEGTNPSITLPWFASFLNFGAGTATLTPASGTISYQGNLAAASMPVPQGCVAVVVFDGTDFWAELVPNIGNVVTQIIAGTNVTISPTSGVGAVTVNATGGGSGTITGVTAGTGLTGGGTSGNVTLAIAATAVTPGSYTNASITVNAEGQLTAASSGSSGTGYIKGTVSIGPEGSAGTYTASGTVTGATVGSVVQVGVSNSTEAGELSNLLGWVTSANTVTIQVTSSSSFLLLNLPVVVFV